jgi:hypothetical protein
MRQRFGQNLLTVSFSGNRLQQRLGTFVQCLRIAEPAHQMPSRQLGVQQIQL